METKTVLSGTTLKAQALASNLRLVEKSVHELKAEYIYIVTSLATKKVSANSVAFRPPSSTGSLLLGAFFCKWV